MIWRGLVRGLDMFYVELGQLAEAEKKYRP
jgi:hypothetical protein